MTHRRVRLSDAPSVVRLGSAGRAGQEMKSTRDTDIDFAVADRAAW